MNRAGGVFATVVPHDVNAAFLSKVSRIERTVISERGLVEPRISGKFCGTRLCRCEPDTEACSARMAADTGALGDLAVQRRQDRRSEGRTQRVAATHSSDFLLDSPRFTRLTNIHPLKKVRSIFVSATARRAR